jgi:exodeoxyribonuclease VII large subunit
MTAASLQTSGSVMVYTVSELTETVRDVLEQTFPLVVVEGEISNLAQPTSGHVYFTLKDTRSQVRCAMFRGRRRRLTVPIANGDQVRVRARVGLYAVRGDFQLIVEQIEPAGEGALRLAFEQLKRRLEQEGLFRSELKRTPPAFPHRLGVITSPTGAALRDILQVLRRRQPGLPVLVYPTAVQGEESVAQILRSLAAAAGNPLCDVLILARGGGSLEDLQAFNDEAVARAIAQSTVPVITGVGHETDFTIADFVADVRAPTPSAAAEMATPDRLELSARIQSLTARLERVAEGRVRQAQQTLDWLEKRLTALHPGRQLRLRQLRLQHLDQSLRQRWRIMLQNQRSSLSMLERRIDQRSPRERLLLARGVHSQLRERLRNAISSLQRQCQQDVGLAVRSLDAVSPLSTLQRGYSIVTTEPDGRLVCDADTVSPGETVRARLSKGALICCVERRAED